MADELPEAYPRSPQDGRLIRVLTGPDDEIRTRIARMTLAGNRGVKILYAKHSFKQLTNAAEQALAVWARLSPTDLHFIAIDERTNSLEATVRPAELQVTSQDCWKS